MSGEATLPRRPWVTAILIAANAAVFVTMLGFGVSPTQPDIESLLRFGANQGTLVVFEHQWWRPFTCMFVHVGALHLLVNMYSLWRVGAFVERLTNPALYLFLYLVAGLGGSFASLLWNPLAVSAGASGAIFGLLGFVIGYAIQARHLMPPDAARSLWDGIVATLLINAVIAVTAPHLDHAGHVGGAFVGLLSGFVATGSAIERQGRGIAFSSQLVVIASVIGLAVLGHVHATKSPEVAATVRLVEAQRELEKNNFDSAERIATSAVGKDPRALLIRAQARHQRGDPDGGLADLDALIEQVQRTDSDELLLIALRRRSEVHLEAGRYQLADADLTRANNGRSHPTYLANRAIARIRLGDVDGGFVDARAALADPRTAGGDLNNAAWALLTSGQDLDLALSLVNEALERDPDSAAAKGTRCWIRVARNEANEGLNDCLQAVASANELLDRGMVAFIQQRPEEALDLWEQAAKRRESDARDVAPWIKRARAQIEQNP